MKLSVALLAASLLLVGVVVATAPTASAECVPGLDRDFCNDPILPDRCYYYPEEGWIVCYWD